MAQINPNYVKLQTTYYTYSFSNQKTGKPLYNWHDKSSQNSNLLACLKIVHFLITNTVNVV